MLREFQTIAWTLDGSSLDRLPLKNDFEKPVFHLHPKLAVAVRKLRKTGAKQALMTGSGSAVFGIFETAEGAASASRSFPANTAWPVRFVTRRQYRSAWRRALGRPAEDTR
jgi:4-diphosphocytidyl-2-C-methyl-D-erythritol kinase